MRRLLIALFLVACAGEPAVLVRLDVQGRPRTRVCLAAYGAGEVRFAQSYPFEEANGGTLAFAAGDLVSGEMRLVGSLRRGGRTLASSFRTASFESRPSATILRIEPGCEARSPSLPAQELARVAGRQLMAYDLDGDGQDEVVAGGDGARAIFADGTPRELHTDTRVMLTVGDLDGDCRDELIEQGMGVGADGLGVVVAMQANAASMGDGGRGPRMALASDEGLWWYELDGGTRFLDDQPSSAVLVADLDNDDSDDIIRAGPRVLDIWLGGPQGPQLAADHVPQGWTGEHLALGDVDGDGNDDVIVGAGDQVLVGRNSRGTLGSRTGPAFDGEIVTGVWAVDVHGDCRDEVIAIAGNVIYLMESVSEDGSLGAPRMLCTDGDCSAQSAAVADMDGNGADELYVLRNSGSVQRWAEMR